MSEYIITKFRKYKFFLKYCIIGVVSIALELIIRNFSLLLELDQLFIIFVPLVFGIIFAFICNIKFNFNIPRYYYKISLIYFIVISLSSFIIQLLLTKVFIFENLNYEITRFVMSGLVFLIAYNFHIKFSFQKTKKVGVAIYLDKNENINEIFLKVGFYPDYIHVDMVDKTMNPDVDDPDLSKFDQIKKIWPNHRIESHIMSKNPLKYIDKLSLYSDVIYFHNEIEDEQKKVKDLILSKGVKAGIVIHTSKNYNNIIDITKNFEEILLLCIDKPGKSGQKFAEKAFSIIDVINNLKNRRKFLLCVDGGLSQKNIKRIDCDKIVSASNVFESINPKKQIINLQKILNN